MDIWKNVQKIWSKTLLTKKNKPEEIATKYSDDQLLDQALNKTRFDLERLLKEKKLSDASKNKLLEDQKQLNRIIQKLEEKHFYIAVFGRVSVGKSSLLNALIGKNHFKTSVLHGETKETKDIFWKSFSDHGLIFIDTPGIDEYQGEARELIAKQTTEIADMILFVIESDLTQIEFDALSELAKQLKPMIVLLNKADRLTEREKEQLKESIHQKLSQLNRDIPLLLISADPREKEVIKVLANGEEERVMIKPEVDSKALKELILSQIEESGQLLQVLSSAIFTNQVGDRIGAEIVQLRGELAAKVIRNYSVGKAITVGLNPVPFLDLAVVFGDVMMVRHLASIYGFEINKRESVKLLKSIIAEMVLILGTSFGVQALLSILKGVSAGLSTILTASTQGVAAYYGTYLVGLACENYFKKGATWGEDGISDALKKIVAGIDKEEILKTAKIDIEAVLKAHKKNQ